MIIILYIFSLAFLILLVSILTLFAVFNLFSIYKGSPFVPTSAKKINEILKKTGLKKGKVFIEPGCGDGRVVQYAVKTFHIKGIGIEINPLLVLYANFAAKLSNNKAQIKQGDIFNYNYKNADYIYLFFFPKTLNRIACKIKSECKPNTLVISHGFKINGWEDMLVEKIKDKPYSTYIYRL